MNIFFNYLMQGFFYKRGRRFYKKYQILNKTKHDKGGVWLKLEHIRRMKGSHLKSLMSGFSISH